MKSLISRLFLILLSLTTLSACSEKGSEQPHPATLYDVCEVAPTENSLNPILHLYRPNANEPIILTAQPGILGNPAPDAGTAILAAYIPQHGTPYTDDNITILTWAQITNIKIQEAEKTEDLIGWDVDPVWLTSAWRAGNKICMRLRLGYESEPRKFALVIDPETIDDEIPTAYLYHQRPTSTPTFDRQYYIAFDITSIWSRPEVSGIRVCIANSANPDISSLLFKK